MPTTARNDTEGSSKMKRVAKINHEPIEGPVLKSDCTSKWMEMNSSFKISKLIDLKVPVFDGRDKFQLGSYWNKPYEGNVEQGSAVMLIFSIKKGNLPKAAQDRKDLPEGTDFSIYLNILVIILLADPGERFSLEQSNEKPQEFGVESIQSMLVDRQVEKQDVEEPYLSGL